MPILSLYFNHYFLSIGFRTYKNFDQGWFEYLGSQNLYNNYVNKSKYYQFLFNNNLKIYLILIIV